MLSLLSRSIISFSLFFYSTTINCFSFSTCIRFFLLLINIVVCIGLGLGLGYKPFFFFLSCYVTILGPLFYFVHKGWNRKWRCLFFFFILLLVIISFLPVLSCFNCIPNLWQFNLKSSIPCKKSFYSNNF